MPEHLAPKLINWASILEDAADLVEIRHTLRQIVNVKGA